MKTTIKYIVLPLCILLITAEGCKKDFLEQSPEATIVGQNFFKTETDIKQAVNGAYSSLNGLGNTSYWLFGEMRSDNTSYQYNATDRGQEQREFVDEFLSSATAPPIQTYWSLTYTAISRCNDVLDHLDAITMTATAKAQYSGEAKFLRAWHYFNLVQQFGGVPLRITAVQSPSDSKSAGRAAVADVYTQIVADLTSASTSLPASYTGADLGRATKGAAFALLGKVYLTQKKFAEALTALRQVTGYSLLPSYASVFDPSNKNNAESVFEIQYLGTKPELASNFLYQFAPWTSGSAVTGDPGTNLGSGNGWNIPTQDMLNAYEAGDARKDVSLGTGFIGSDGKFVNVPYVKKYNHGFVDRNRTNDDFPILRYSDVLLMMAEALNEQGFTAGGEAFTLLNRVRTRAALPDKSAGNANPLLAVNDQAAFRAAVLQERRVELAFENQRWYDLVRSGTAVTVMTAHGQREMQQFSNIPAGSYVVTANKLLLPLPQRDVTLDNLTQNPQ
ncbi:Starch-binding associating with outer membrane [Pedobacter westerhofensis]|uniref:Starch-binding associating with outer membrane n=1 Tax=Pedobacter westerhofensis TaxID=425512 RepID=A0A521EJY8_9SPHI|nr:RagB/SusD family nutrient uptake outer membrane protein [Pedobacter westerhofensis]SMO83450.1 Starch-binding associating with outer membrane [Pedobacter westerhofensis]